MKVKLVKSSTSGDSRVQFVTSLVINDRIAIDAGCLGFSESPQKQLRIKHVFISHTHIDHIASLPIFIENVYQRTPECVIVYGSRAVLDGLQTHIFNGVVWPDLINLSPDDAPFVRLHELETGRPVQIGDLRLTPVEMDHVVPTHGFVIEEASGTVVVALDTGPTKQFWKVVRGYDDVKAVFLESTFPNSMSELARLSKHLTPQMFQDEIRKYDRKVRWIAIHLKASLQQQVADELAALGIENLEVGVQGKEYVF